MCVNCELTLGQLEDSGVWSLEGIPVVLKEVVVVVGAKQRVEAAHFVSHGHCNGFGGVLRVLLVPHPHSVLVHLVALLGHHSPLFSLVAVHHVFSDALFFVNNRNRKN